MPYARKRKIVRKTRVRRPTRRTAVRRKARRAPAEASISRGSPFPAVKRCALRYHDTKTLTSTSGSCAYNVFLANGMFDPDQTGTGHQPRFFDQLLGSDAGGAPYGKYRVLSSVISVRFMNTNSSVAAIGYAGIRQRHSETTNMASIVPYDMGEIPNMKYKLVNISTGIGNWPIVSMKSNITKMLGIKDIKDSEDCTGTYLADPAEIVMFDVFFLPRDGTTSTSIYYDVSITYFVELFDQNITQVS